jgi:enoyl-CoA hydratase
MSGTYITVEQEGRVAVWRFDNPPHNFLNRKVIAELDELVGALEHDESVGAVVFTGKPEDLFITHYDVAEILAGSEGFGRAISAGVAGASLRTVGGAARVPGAREALRRSPAGGLLEAQKFQELLLRMNRMDKVFIAAINGPALGGGCEFSLACDIRYIASETGRLGQPEMLVGFPPGGGGTQRLTHAVGTSRALELMLEGRVIEPDEAREIGLAHRVLPRDELLAEARATAERLARRSPYSVSALKRAVLAGSTRPLAAGLAVEQKWFLAACSRPAARRAMRAYLDDLERDGAPAFREPDALDPWLEGTRVDVVSE